MSPVEGTAEAAGTRKQQRGVALYHIMVVDDAEGLAHLESLLAGAARLRARLHHVPRVQDAEEAIFEWNFDACLLSYRVADRSSSDLLRLVKARELTLPIVVLADEPDDEVDDEVMSLGAADFIPKHELNANLLQRTILHGMARVQAEHALRKSEEDYRELAEFASATLHNVANLLNSASISCERATRVLMGSRVANLKRTVRMMAEYDGPPEKFFLEDPRGKMLTSYLPELSDMLTSENEELGKELDSAFHKLRLMSDIIAWRKPETRRGREQRELDLVSLLEEALEVKGSAILRYNVSVRRRYRVRPMIEGNRPNLVHVLINLVKNAVEAMAHTSGSRLLQVEVYEKDGLAHLSIRDTGCGIDAEQERNLFQYGFTTKKDGHGYGLHFCAKVISELGGTIDAYSEGEGEGATFDISLPVVAVKAYVD